MLRATERYLVLVAGRRFGKTIFAIAWLIARVLERPPGATGYYVLPFRVQAKDIAWRVLLAATRSFRTGKNDSELYVSLPGERRIALKGADDPERLEGVGLVAAVLDEFAKMKLSAWENSLRPALSDHAGRALFIGKPRGHNHLKRFYDRGTGPTKRATWRSWLFCTADGGFVSATDIEEARRDLPPRIFRQEYLASFELLAGKIYEEFSSQYAPAGHVVSAEKAPKPTEFNAICIGIDWGFTHPGVAVVIGEASGGLLFVIAEEWHEEFRVEQWETCIRALHGRFPRAVWRADPSRPDLIASYSAKVGIDIRPAENDVNDGILEVMKVLHPKGEQGPSMLVSDACPRVIAGLDTYVWDTTKQGEPLEKPMKKNDDAADATRYGVMGLRRRDYVGPVDDGFMDEN